MPTFREFLNRLQFFRRRSSFDREMHDELQFHIEARAAELEERGLSKDEALRRARAEFGSVQLAREDSLEAWQFQWLEHLLMDLRVGLRMLWRSPGFSILAILCLTLGIGANAAVFSWVEGILFRPYPAVVHQERLMALSGISRGETGITLLSWPDYLDLQRNCTLFDAFFVSKITGTTLSIGERAERTLGKHRFRELFRRHRRAPHPRPRIFARRRCRQQRASGNGDQLPALAGPLQRRSADHRQNAAPQRRNTHHRRRRAARFLRNFRRLGHAVLGSGLHGRNLRKRRIQTRGSQRAMDRIVCASEARSHRCGRPNRRFPRSPRVWSMTIH